MYYKYAFMYVMESNNNPVESHKMGFGECYMQILSLLESKDAVSKETSDSRTLLLNNLL